MVSSRSGPFIPFACLESMRRSSRQPSSKPIIIFSCMSKRGCPGDMHLHFVITSLNLLQIHDARESDALQRPRSSRQDHEDHLSE